MTPTKVAWQAVSRERHVRAPRDRAWAVVLAHLGADPDADLSVEPPWRHVRVIRIDGVARTEVAVVLRDDGPECHLAWSAGTTAEGDAGAALLGGLAGDGEALLVRVAEEAEEEHGDG